MYLIYPSFSFFSGPSHTSKPSTWYESPPASSSGTSESVSIEITTSCPREGSSSATCGGAALSDLQATTLGIILRAMCATCASYQHPTSIISLSIMCVLPTSSQHHVRPTNILHEIFQTTCYPTPSHCRNFRCPCRSSRSPHSGQGRAPSIFPRLSGMNSFALSLTLSPCEKLQQTCGLGFWAEAAVAAKSGLLHRRHPR